MDPSTSETLYENPVTAETVKRVIEVSRETGIHLNLYSDDKLYVEMKLRKERHMLRNRTEICSC